MVELYYIYVISLKRDIVRNMNAKFCMKLFNLTTVGHYFSERK